jgi:hypothetical protein
MIARPSLDEHAEPHIDGITQKHACGGRGRGVGGSSNARGSAVVSQHATVHHNAHR